MASILALSGGPPAHTSVAADRAAGSDIRQPAPRAGLDCVRALRAWAGAGPEGHQLHSTAPAGLFRTRIPRVTAPAPLRKAVLYS